MCCGCFDVVGVSDSSLIMVVDDCHDDFKDPCNYVILTYAVGLIGAFILGVITIINLCKKNVGFIAFSLSSC